MRVLIGLCLFVLTVFQVMALECYSCKSGCNDEFISTGIAKVQCTGSCTKTKSKDGMVTRGCLSNVKTDDCKDENDVTFCLCTSDRCNGATVKYMSSFGLITTIACVILNYSRNVLY